jgi:hypothetical protein
MSVRERSRWTLTVGAIALAAALDFTANWLAAHYLLAIGPFVIPSGSLTFALAFTTYDYIRRFLRLLAHPRGHRTGLCRVHRL